jgi:hypothetical protein
VRRRASVIEFRLSDYAFADEAGRVPTVDAVIDGRSLYDLVNDGNPDWWATASLAGVRRR